jgi:hypothetical protein
LSIKDKAAVAFLLSTVNRRHLNQDIRESKRACRIAWAAVAKASRGNWRDSPLNKVELSSKAGDILAAGAPERKSFLPRGGVAYLLFALTPEFPTAGILDLLVQAAY